MRTVYRLCFLDYHPDMLEYVENPIATFPFKDYFALKIKSNKESGVDVFKPS